MSISLEFPTAFPTEKLVLRKGAFRWAALTPVLALMFFREQDSFDGPASAIYDKVLGGFRWIDLFLIVAILGTLILSRGNRREWILPKPLLKPASLFCAAWLFSIIYGLLRGGTNVFFDWRGIALGVGLVCVFSYWIDSPFALYSAVRSVLWIFAIRAIWIFLAYASGGGVTEPFESVRTPLFDGSTLSIACFMAVLGFSFTAEETRLLQKAIFLIPSLLASALVYISLRRTFWIELFIAVLILIFPNRKLRAAAISAFSGGLILAMALFPGILMERLKSFNVLEGNDASEYAATNLDHIGDLLDAWDQIQAHPITGLGQGYAYETDRIRVWKTESWMVHNAPLHVWLRYGITGLFAYLWFHIAVFRWIRQVRSNPNRWIVAFGRAGFAYLVAQFIARLGFAPWPYGETQSCIAIAFILGGLFSVATFAFPKPTFRQA